MKELPCEDEDIDPFTLEEVGKILTESEGQERNLFQFAIWSGLRTSELIALRWEDVDWDARELRVWRAYTAKETKTTKTKAGRRRVVLLSPALEALKVQRTYSLLKGEHVFLHPRLGLPWSGDKAIRRRWEAVLARAEVRYRYPYQTRHTYASLMLTAGENPLWVANQMGHTDTNMIFRRYGKWIKDVTGAGNKAEEIAKQFSQKGQE